MDSVATGIAGLNGFLVLAGPLNIPVLLLFLLFGLLLLVLGFLLCGWT